MRVDRATVPRVPFEVIVGCGRIPRGADVADDGARANPSEVAVPDQMRVEDVAAVATDANLVATERGGGPPRVAVERSADRRPRRRLDVVAQMHVWLDPGQVYDLAEVVVDEMRTVDRTHPEDPPGVQPGLELAPAGAE